jgi:hypothetical protein
MKENYNEIELEIVFLDNNDVITASDDHQITD